MQPRKGRVQVRIQGSIQKKQEIKKERRFGKRSEYGVNYGLPGLGDDVELTVAVTCVRQ